MIERANEAGELLAEVLGDGMTAVGAGGHFTCSEADKIATALLLLGHPAAARMWLEGHAEGDDDPDDQHVPEEGETTATVATSHVRMLAGTHGIALHDELNVPDDLRNEPPTNSVRTVARNIVEGQRVKVWGYRDDDPWPRGKSGFHEGVVEVIEFQPMVSHGVPAVHIKLAKDDLWLHAVAEAVTYIVNVNN